MHFKLCKKLSLKKLISSKIVENNSLLKYEKPNNSYRKIIRKKNENNDLPGSRFSLFWTQVLSER